MHNLYFDTDGFRDPIERKHQNANEIEGYGLARFLSRALEAEGFTIEAIFDDDDGWSFYADRGEERYFVATSLIPVDAIEGLAEDDREGEMFANINIARQRAILDRFTGQKRMTPDDPVTAAISAALEDHPEVLGLKISY